MTDVVTTIANFIKSPPVEWVAGPTLFTTFWAVAKGLQSIINPVASAHLSQSLRGLHTGSWIHGLQEGFQALFVKLFGRTFLSIKRLFRSLLLTGLVSGLAVAIDTGQENVSSDDLLPVFGRMVMFLYLPIYGFLFIQKSGFSRVNRSGIIKGFFYLAAFSIIGIVVSTGILFGSYVEAPQFQLPTLTEFQLTAAILAFMIVAVMSFIGLLVGVFVALLLRILLKVNYGFGWLFSLLKIDEKPVEMIGVVAGALLCLGWWIFVFVHRLRAGQL